MKLTMIRDAWPAGKDALSGSQAKPTIVLLSSVLLMLTWKYFGSPEFFAQQIAPHWVLWDRPAASAGIYCLVSCFLLLGVVPALIVKFAFRERLADYGVSWGQWKYTLRACVVFVPMFLFVAWAGSHNEALRETYPLNPEAAGSRGMFALHVGTYLLFYLGWEFHFRGFLQFGLRGSMGPVNALLVQVTASGLLHIGHPAGETFGALAVGVLWGMLAFRTRSLLAGLVQHATLGIALDYLICYA